MDKVSILIPSYREPYLLKTLADILEKAEGDIEILVNLDSPHGLLIKDRRITYFKNKKTIGMRAGINKCLQYADGKYIMKSDAHCIYDKGFDTKLKKDMKANWLVVPRRYSLMEHSWEKLPNRMRVRDYHYLSYPVKTDWGEAMFPLSWRKTNKKMIDDTMVFQGSCWFANKDFFMKTVGFLDDKHYGPIGAEQIEVCMKYWTRGGEVKVNKYTWYAHLHKTKNFYYKNKIFSKWPKKSPEANKGRTWATEYWMKHKKFKWLIKKFWPLPNWPKDYL